MSPFEHTLFFLERYKKPMTLVPSPELLKLKISVKHRRVFRDYDYDVAYKGIQKAVERQ